MAEERVLQSACAEAHGIKAFDLFCAYHLGIQADGTYRFGNVHDVAKRFQVGAAVVRQCLEEFALRPDDLWNLKWDLSEAQVAIAVAEESTDLSRVAFEHWRALLNAPKRKRDWAKELAKDRAVNEELFKGLKGEF